MALKAVIFDYGHTIVDFTVPEDALLEAYGVIRSRLVQEAERELPESDELVERVARSIVRAVDASYQSDRLAELDIIALFQKALAGLGFSPSPSTVRWVAETEHEALGRNLIAKPKTIATLKELHRWGIRIGIVSNAHLLPDMMRKDWDRLGFGQFVSASVISCEIGIRKPAPIIFETALRKLGVEPEEAVFVGDRMLDDVQGAHGVGMRAILSREFRDSSGRIQGAQELRALATEQPDLIVDRLEDILPYLRSLAA